jgi:hypothetical protein
MDGPASLKVSESECILTAIGAQLIHSLSAFIIKYNQSAQPYRAIDQFK